MNLIKLATFSSASSLLLSACITMPGTQNQAAESKPVDNRECAKNYSIDGSSLSIGGKKFSTTAFVPGVSKVDAMSRASKKLASDGLSIAVIDRDAGLLTATNKVIMGKGNRDSAPLAVTFEPAKGGVQVQLKFAIAFGQVADEEDMKNNLCSVVAAVAGMNRPGN